jgi:uroporphyrinogen-III synthase
VEVIRSGALDGVILMSPRTGSIFAELVAAAGLAESARRLAFFCLSDAVSASLKGLRPMDVRVARRPNAEEVLALVASAAPESG